VRQNEQESPLRIFALQGSLQSFVNREKRGFFDNNVQDEAKLVELTKIETSDVYDVLFSPNGKLLVTTYFATMQLWTAETVKKVGTTVNLFACHITCQAFSPDNSMLAAGDRDGWVGIWSTATQIELKGLEVNTDKSISKVEFSPDGKLLACGSTGGDVRLFDTADWSELAVLDAGCDEIQQLAFSPDSNMLVSATHARIQRWDSVIEYNSFEQIGETLYIPTRPDQWMKVRSLAVSQRTNLIAICCESGVDGSKHANSAFVILWDFAAGCQQTVARESNLDNGFEKASFHQGGTILRTISRKGTIRNWNADSGVEIGQPQRFDFGDCDVGQTVFSSDGRTYATKLRSGDVILMRVQDPTQLRSIRRQREES
jgi:WD40 repeat protein